MSTLVAQTISNGTVSTSSANVIQGSAKAWVNFNGQGTVAIRASYNVSSITDNGTGLYTVNFTNTLPDANYAVSAAASPIYAGGSSFVNLFSNSSTTETAPTTSAFTLRCGFSSSGTTEDLKYICVSVFD